MKVAHVYDWLVTMGGGERTLAALLEIYPAPIHTLVHDPLYFADQEVHPSFLQKFPFAKRLYRYYLPFFPLAIEQFDLNDYDLVISSSHAVSKGVLTHMHQLHLCYCLTPVRYAWDLTHRYLEGLSGLQKFIAQMTLHYLRNWDVASAGRVDHFAAISQHVARRIKKVYGKPAEVIYPPVDVELIPFQSQAQDFYLTVSRMVPYKRLDLIVEAFSYLPHQRLVVIGDGPEMKKIKAKAGKNIEILGHQPDAVVRDYLGKAKGFIFAAEEDFGIVVLEAQAAGTPVIALGKGGALETVIPQRTGIFFDEQTVASLLDAIQKFEKMSFDPEVVREHAQQFNRLRFQREFKQFVEKKLEEHHESRYSRGG
jgi:glycosyltransferase involved in cell wall biosynthesis